MAGHGSLRRLNRATGVHGAGAGTALAEARFAIEMRAPSRRSDMNTPSMLHRPEPTTPDVEPDPPPPGHDDPVDPPVPDGLPQGDPPSNPPPMRMPAGAVRHHRPREH